MENYRPLVIIDTFSKILEYAMLDRLRGFLSGFGVLNSGQFGFRSGLSVLDATMKFYESVMESINAGERPVGIFCDLSRAFDSVDHEILLDKLTDCGIRGVAAKWFTSYLRGRRQFVEVSRLDGGCAGKCRSGLLSTTVGVPQGSILGPVLFTIYVNDLCQRDGVVMYADDTSLFASGVASAVESRANEILDEVGRYFLEHRLLLNNSKTHFMEFHISPMFTGRPLDLHVNNSPINRTSDIKFLGITFQDNLQWKLHCNSLIKKINSCCHLMRSLRDTLDCALLKTLYHAHVASRINYGITIWGSSSMLHDVFLAQKRVVRCIASVTRTHSCRTLFSRYGILPVPCVYMLHLLVFTYKRRECLSLAGSNHGYDTRTRGYRLPFPRVECYRKSPFYLGIQLYDLLPEDIKVLSSDKIFKKRVTKLLLDNVFYGVDEYVAHFNMT